MSRPSDQPPARTAAYASVRLVSNHESAGISDHAIESPVNAASAKTLAITQTPRNRSGVSGRRGRTAASAHSDAPTRISTTAV